MRLIFLWLGCAGMGQATAEPGSDTAGILELPSARVRAASTTQPEPGTLRLEARDMRRAVSALGDPARILQTLPGVGRPNDWENTLIVRGGSPDQTMFVVDGVSMRRVNHYEGMRNEHGGTGVLNLDLVDTLAFHRGSFPARLPDRLSGVVEIGFRDGDSSHVRRIAADATGAGSGSEGPLAGGTYAGAFRYSSLDLLVRGGLVEAYGIPRYYNGQTRIAFPAGSSILRFNALGGREVWRNGIEDVAQLDVGGHTFSSALDWQGPGQTRATLYYQDRGQQGSFQSLTGQKAPGRDSLTRQEQGRETRAGFSASRLFPLGTDFTLRLGGEENLYRRRLLLAAGDEQIYLPDRDTTVSFSGSLRAGSGLHSEAAAYAEATWSPGPWELYAGYRHFYEELSDGHGFGPRLALRYRAASGQAVGWAGGLHTQPHEYADLARRSDPRSARLPLMLQSNLAWDWVGAAHALTLEAFAKEGFRLARSSLAPVEGGRFASVAADTGRTRSLGFEAYLRRPRSGFLSYTAAYSYLWHRERHAAGSWGKSPQSVPHAFNTSFELALFRNPGRGAVYLGFRYSQAAGIPVIPFDTAASRRSRAGVYDLDRAYSVSERPFERTDLRLEWERFVGWGRVAAFVEVENFTGRRNYFERRWNPLDGTVTVMEGMGRLPVAGLAVTF